MKSINFSLIENARDSIEKTVELLAWPEIKEDQSRLKHSILNSSHAVELLLKEKLRSINPAFV